MISTDAALCAVYICTALLVGGGLLFIVFAIARKPNAATVFGVAAIIGIVGIVAMVAIMKAQQDYLNKDAGEATVESVQEGTQNAVDLSVTFDEIYKAYKENELVADDLYQYNRYQITAKISGMETGGLLNLTGGATLTMEKRVGNTAVFFYAEFEKEQEEALKKVKVGDTITFDGNCIGKGGFTDCEIK